jgi:hypothetical protein
MAKLYFTPKDYLTLITQCYKSSYEQQSSYLGLSTIL